MKRSYLDPTIVASRARLAKRFNWWWQSEEEWQRIVDSPGWPEGVRSKEDQAEASKLRRLAYCRAAYNYELAARHLYHWSFQRQKIITYEFGKPFNLLDWSNHIELRQRWPWDERQDRLAGFGAPSDLLSPKQMKFPLSPQHIDSLATPEQIQSRSVRDPEKLYWLCERFIKRNEELWQWIKEMNRPGWTQPRMMSFNVAKYTNKEIRQVVEGFLDGERHRQGIDQPSRKRNQGNRNKVKTGPVFEQIEDIDLHLNIPDKGKALGVNSGNASKYITEAVALWRAYHQVQGETG